jgi:hypothetical protein
MTPKDLILDAIKSKFSKSGITKMMLSFNVIDDTYNVHLKNSDDKDLVINITGKEMTLIKMMFINKVKRKYEKENKEDLKMMIVTLDLTTDKFDIYTENLKGNVYKFDY